VDKGGARHDPTAAPRPGHLLDEGVGALLWRPSNDADNQVDDRGLVTA